MSSLYHIGSTAPSTSVYAIFGLVAALCITLLLMAVSATGAPDLASYGAAYP